MISNGHSKPPVTRTRSGLVDPVAAAMIGAAVPESLLVIDVGPRNGGNADELETLAGPLPKR